MKKKAMKAQIALMAEDLHAKDRHIEALEQNFKQALHNRFTADFVVRNASTTNVNEVAQLIALLPKCMMGDAVLTASQVHGLDKQFMMAASLAVMRREAIAKLTPAGVTR